MASVTLKKVEKAYDGLKTVHGLDLQVADGEFIVLVGPSGCGKSTTLRMIAGLETVTGGEIAINGKRVNELQPGERDIAMVFQNYALYPHLSVAENIIFGLKLRKTPKAEVAQRLKRTAEILGLEKLLERKPRQLSGGQRQRVAMGRALIRNPSVFLFDEPLSNLDAKLRVQMRTEIKELHARIPTTTVYVTHDQIEAMTLADRVVVMNAGRIEQIASPEELYQFPATRFVAGFIGSPGMNFFTVDVEANGTDLAIKLGDGQTAPHDFMRENYRRVTQIKGPVHEIPTRDCMVSLDPMLKDKWGRPVARLSGVVHSETQRTAQFLLERAKEWLVASGATRVWGHVPPPRLSAYQHQAGTCRMGDDPRQSVTDPYGRVWGHDNLFVADASLHPTNGGFNPVLTVMALAFRSADHILSL
eukprot:jgi/Tetstr1/450341/TSEL_037377.t1